MSAFEDFATVLGLPPDELRSRALARAAEVAAGMGRFGRWFLDGHAENRFEKAASELMRTYGPDGVRSVNERGERVYPPNYEPHGWEDYALERFVWHIGGPIRPMAAGWPKDKLFPMSDEFCAATMQGYAVRWGGTKDEMLNELPGRWELWSGHLVARS